MITPKLQKGWLVQDLGHMTEKEQNFDLSPGLEI